MCCGGKIHMKNTRKILFLCFVVASLMVMMLIFFGVCRIPPIFDPTIVDKKPCGQPNTKWISADKSIVLNVDSEHTVTGTIKIGSNDIKICVFFEREAGTGMRIFPEMNEKEYATTEELEYWSCWYKSKKKFVATVKTTTFFEEDQKITFYRVEE